MAPTDWVVDASVAAKTFVEEADSARVRELLLRLGNVGRLMAPTLLRYELGNILRRRLPKGDPDNFLAMALRPMELVEPAAVFRYAASLSYYDASYLALAAERKAGLLTADQSLLRAARAHGIATGP